MKRKFFILSISILIINAQSSQLEFKLLSNKYKTPFWLISNQSGSNPNSYDFSHTSKVRKFRSYSFIFDTKASYSNQEKKVNYEKAYLELKNNKLSFKFGRFFTENDTTKISSGSLIESSNATPVPRILFSIPSFKLIKIYNFKFLAKGKLAHGWFDKGRYLRAPFLHQKSLTIKKNIFDDFSASLGLVHMAIWGGSTKLHGVQATTFNDYLRVVFFQPGSKKNIYQERKNALGNHLGIWKISLFKKLSNESFNFYYEHPFEDQSSARWMLNKLDGKFGLNYSNSIHRNLSSITYEYINTMNQSGPVGASDSTYGWDNYFNHFIYQSGWTNKDRMIGNPLFTVGKNTGRYSEKIYIINNRIIAHHFGLSGKVRHNASYRMLFTYSKNYGNYPDKDYYRSIGEDYKFDDGLDQLSTLYEIKIKNLWNNISITAAYANDRGELLPKTDSFMMIINYKL